MPFATRSKLQEAIIALSSRDMSFVAGLEVEFHLYRRESRVIGCGDIGQPGVPPDTSHTSRGYQYLTEQRFDAAEPLLELFRVHLEKMDLPLRTMEVEMGPSQFEFTLAASSGDLAADNMVLLRTALKSIAERNGLHATFMCRPKFPGSMASGWHLHQSLRKLSTGSSLMPAVGSERGLSSIAQHYVAGLLKHARAGTIFSTPTVNGYKRYRANSLAPLNIGWAHDNRGAMIRAITPFETEATRIENRIGEPLANPYLYLASQIYAGLDGLEEQLALPPSTDEPYATSPDKLPTSLPEAIAEVGASELFRKAFGDQFIDYYTFIKLREYERYEAEITEWEHKEYFEMY